MKTDIEIANEVTLSPITEIALKLGIPEEKIECYGKYKAKLSLNLMQESRAKLILVTSTNPTPYGEGKTTITIGLNDALCHLGKKSIATLREPSLGPVFGIKGGATGGGYAQIVPMEDINLHFTGDIHAVTACNNLLCAMVDNHIFQGNELEIDSNTIQITRCLDINDRALRNIHLKGKNERDDSFIISTASEIMAILCLSENLMDLKKNLGHILVAYTIEGKPIYVSDLKGEEALTILLKDAIKPNLVQSLEHNPIIVHGGPFANIAHGCNSIIATKMALSLADYVVTEAGFGSDLGAFKFMDIKCRKMQTKPDLVIINTTIRSLKYNGNGNLEEGICNLQAHIDMMQKMNSNLLICLNQFLEDTAGEIDYVKHYVEKQGLPFEICNAYSQGGKGAVRLAEKVVKQLKIENTFTLPYSLDSSFQEKIEIIFKNFYQADTIIIEESAKKEIQNIEELGFQNLPICVAKTQYSLSDDAKMLGYPKHHTIQVTHVRIAAGAKFIIVYLGNIMTMPGLSKNPAYLHMSIDPNANIEGLY